jgi:hypothetical protein
MSVDYPGFPDNPENRSVQNARTVRFERWQNPTEKNPNPEPTQVPMQFEVAGDINGMPGVVGRATIRGAMYAIGLRLHDIQWMLEEAEREADRRRGSYGG